MVKGLFQIGVFIWTGKEGRGGKKEKKTELELVENSNFLNHGLERRTDSSRNIFEIAKVEIDLNELKRFQNIRYGINSILIILN